MLTRLKVSGFKNLVDVEVWFGPFTCIAGANGVGKSNLFDAIVFLSALADRPLIDAALAVRDEGGRTGDIRSLFHHIGDQFTDEINFEADMIIPSEGTDDLGQVAVASSTFVKYSLELRYIANEASKSLGSIQLTREELAYIKSGDARKLLPFAHSEEWRRSAVKGRRWTPHYISTVDDDRGARVIKVHQDGGSSGKARSLLAANLPRTALSAANAAESPTATLAHREMQSWRLLQLEPSALREPDAFSAPSRLGSDGAHLPAALYHLAKSESAASGGEAGVYAKISNALARLIPDVEAVSVDRDERRELLTVYVTARDGTAHSARSLSDGTLRFLALAVLGLDPKTQGLICLEEPENGIHPEQIPAILELLQNLATDTRWEIGPDNPLRQVIINTHSPAVVLEVPDDSLLIAQLLPIADRTGDVRTVAFRCLAKTWRHKADVMKVAAKGTLLPYVNPVTPDGDSSEELPLRRVVDRDDVQQYKFEFQS